ncbi:hypothetical protein C2S53_013124 [Perilla frutescens var. hirtella]|uniref:Uncharacterized protein n=1 Tax=Perilla frutescens var. hirtella TaxID=608512 RepID=A0AAD4P7A5_PERFH|nr:hypothetical protein C2S53_013124 [Perilla frutescens var. hirtella]
MAKFVWIIFLVLSVGGEEVFAQRQCMAVIDKNGCYLPKCREKCNKYYNGFGVCIGSFGTFKWYQPRQEVPPLVSVAGSQLRSSVKGQTVEIDGSKAQGSSNLITPSTVTKHTPKTTKAEIATHTPSPTTPLRRKLTTNSTLYTRYLHEEPRRNLDKLGRRESTRTEPQVLDLF